MSNVPRCRTASGLSSGETPNTDRLPTLDLSKLTPATWFCEKEPTKIILSSSDVQRIAWVFDNAFDENHTEFIALARNAFNIMMRRGWRLVNGVQHGVDGLFWAAQGPFDHHEIGVDGKWHSDPFTALIEADRWFSEHVENGVTLPHAGCGGKV